MMSMSMGGDTSNSGNVTNLPLSDPRCDNDACDAFAAAHAASQAAVSYSHQFDYGHYTTWYYLVVIGLSMVVYAHRLYRNRRPPPSRTAPSIGHKAMALLRMVNYKHATSRTARFLCLPSLGTGVFLLGTALFLLLMTFLVHPYYRQRRGYGSPPLAVRAGLMAQALIPLIVALAGKVNIITFLTGIGHEKLNFFHRWVSYMCLFLSVVHTLPFIIQPLKEGGAAGLRAQYYHPGGLEFTGTPALGMLVGLSTLSVPWIRNHFYNLFYRIHIPMYITFLGLIFWHSCNILDSWAYLWATLALWLSSVTVRLFYKWQTFSVFRAWFQGFPATLEELPGGTTRVRLLVPLDLQWKPGQHCWLRIPHLSIAQNHPFTIANLSIKALQDASKYDDLQEMKFYIRSNRGLSRALLQSVAEKHDQAISVHLDGPYGGLVEDIPALYESIIFVAGGSGISACLPHILHAAQRIQQGNAMVRDVRLVWIVRQPAHLKWIFDELETGLGVNVHPEWLHLDFYVTDTSLSSSSEDGLKIPTTAKEAGLDSIEQDKNNRTPKFGTLRNVRPFLPDLVPPLVTARRVMIFGCGPESLKADLANAAVLAQKRVLVGKSDVVALHTEMFGW